MTALEVVATGPLTTIQDLGRPGLAHLGVGPSGACDRASLALANRLVGNAPGAAALEITLGGVEIVFPNATWVALAGARSDLDVGGRVRDFGTPVPVPAGATLRLALAPRGVRSYLAVRGGIAVPPVLGSRSTDLLTGLGPPVVQPGDVLAVGDDVTGPVPSADVVALPAYGGTPTLTVQLGPRDDWFAPAGLDTLLGTAWTVSPDSNRVGLRLCGPPITRLEPRELPSEGLISGAVQVPPSGRPIVFLADHPTTGGYPVIATVHPESLAAAAQLRVGQGVRFAIRRGTRGARSRS